MLAGLQLEACASQAGRLRYTPEVERRSDFGIGRVFWDRLQWRDSRAWGVQGRVAWPGSNCVGCARNHTSGQAVPRIAASSHKDARNPEDHDADALLSWLQLFEVLHSGCCVLIHLCCS